MLRPALHSRRSDSLSNLASALFTRFEQVGQLVDLEEAISLFMESLMLRPASHPRRSDSLTNLASAIKTRFEQTGQLVDLDEAISLHRESLVLCPAPHPHRSASLSNLASAVLTRFDQTGQLVDLEEAISLYGESLTLRPAPHPGRSDSLNNLASAVFTQFEQTGQLVDLEETILFYRECLVLRPAPYPGHSDVLNNLASAVLRRFEQTGQLVDLEEAISFYRECLVLRPTSHPRRSVSLNNLAITMMTQFEQTGQLVDLEETTSLHRESLVLRPAPHPDRSDSLYNLASAVLMRFKHTGQLVDLEETISLYREALHCLPASHPHRCRILYYLASTLCHRITSPNCFTNESLDMAIDSFRAAFKCETASVLDRLTAAQEWARHADELQHSSALEAYEAAIHFLPLVAMLTASVQSRHRLLANKVNLGLANDAAACAIRMGQSEQAVELLEEGRAVFWSQALRLRTPLDDLQQVHPELAKQLQTLSVALEKGSFHAAPRNLEDDARGFITLEAEAAKFRRLHEQWLETLKSVRALEGFEQYLLPQKLESLKAAAARGPVVLLNATQSSCDALIVTLTGVQHIPLSSNLTGRDIATLADSVYSAASRSRLSQTTQTLLETLVQKAKGSRSVLLNEEDRKLRPRPSPRPQPEPDILRDVLATLWYLVVRPVILTLELKVHSSKGLPFRD